jgi:hypothetical protein
VNNSRNDRRVNVQFRAEFFNFFNRAAFDGPENRPTRSDFGRITRQRNLPRTTQLALRFTW